MTHMSIVEARDRLSDALNRVAYGGERVVLERRGKGVAVLVSMDDLALLEAVEDEHWAREARKALAEMKRKGEKPVPLEQVERELGSKATDSRPAPPGQRKRKSA